MKGQTDADDGSEGYLEKRVMEACFWPFLNLLNQN